LQQLPSEQLQQMMNAVGDQFAALDESMIVQAAAAAIRAENDALGVDAQRLQTNYILQVGGLMLLVSLGVVTSVIIINFLSSRTGAGFARDLAPGPVCQGGKFFQAEFETFSTASLITRSTNDITQMQMVVTMMLRMLFFAPIMAVGAIIRAVENSPSMTWIIGLGVAVLLVMVVIIFSITLPKFRAIQNLVDRLNLVTRENLSGLMVIRAFNTQEFELARFDKANKDLTKTMLFVNRIMAIVFPFMTLVMSGMSLLVIWVGSQQVAQSNLQVGDMMAFLQYAMQVVFSFLMMTMMFIFLPRASVSGKRIDDVLRIDPVIKDPQQPLPFDSHSRGLIEFRNVSFRYPGAEENVLCNISFTAKPGETTAILGGTGSGKSTLVNLIPRFFDVTEGAVYVDGRDVREVAQSDLRDRIGYIPQRGVLFSGTVESNLRYADENATAEELAEALEIAQAEKFVAEMEGGINAPIAQGGANVSGGQKQRLSIARVILKDPRILVLDEATSSLDSESEALIQDALKRVMQQRTSIVIAHRLSTILAADLILVIDRGRVVEQGNHNELLKLDGLYASLYRTQFKGNA